MGAAGGPLGRRLILVVTAVASAVGLLALSAVPVHDTWEMAGVALIAGAGQPPVSAAVRSLWPRLVEGGSSDAVYAIDSTLQELTFVAGPALVACWAPFRDGGAPWSQVPSSAWSALWPWPSTRR